VRGGEGFVFFNCFKPVLHRTTPSADSVFLSSIGELYGSSRLSKLKESCSRWTTCQMVSSLAFPILVIVLQIKE
jgi:hypothetical protein